jgi:hypothetical protein
VPCPNRAALLPFRLAAARRKLKFPAIVGRHASESDGITSSVDSLAALTWAPYFQNRIWNWLTLTVQQASTHGDAILWRVRKRRVTAKKCL